MMDSWVVEWTSPVQKRWKSYPVKYYSYLSEALNKVAIEKEKDSILLTYSNDIRYRVVNLTTGRYIVL